ncbi:aspartyl protease family protein [Flavivirga abyssicola]|uniref:aspartyl protease family protein n=1 Tax=Flavivirga abyssicola TaxID=3063533 RepID=UPI0026E065D9|nr:aspartyl protease family protein [Flavivirga sp. MEBiC07777]WVK12736.1 aspartyl protease family protein [Flavivirga sp. MEBiC07777]
MHQVKVISYFFLCFIIFNCKSKDKTAPDFNPPLAKVPFNIEGSGLVFVKGKINNKKNVHNFLFDTGVSSEILDEKEAKKFNFVYAGSSQSKDASGTKTNPVAHNQIIKLPPTDIEIPNVKISSVDLSNLRHMSKDTMHGILGYSLPARYYTQIDYDDKHMLLYNSMKDISLEGYTPVPFEFIDDINIPFIALTFQLKNGKYFTGKVLFDTGYNGTLIINTGFNEKHQISSQIDKKLVSSARGVSGAFKTEKVAIQAVHIDSLKLSHIPVNISYSEGGFTSDNNIMGILGAGIIHKFNYVLDYPKKIIYLKPNAYAKRTYKLPLSSIEFIKKEGTIIISSVDESSPAYKSGLRIKDNVLSINAKPLKTPNEYYKITEGKEGDIITIKVAKPNGKEENIIFQLMPLL